MRPDRCSSGRRRPAAVAALLVTLGGRKAVGYIVGLEGSFLPG
ncbi:MAG: hypothetical protein ACLUYK_01600 [Eggerthella lenta]